ncbi:MAG: hypothetical protein Q3971_02155 [Moraxella sp.]|nr:hypothetical protein [Moraxella sp.]
MTKINQSDLQFFPSERLDDTDEGGGQPLGTAVAGKANEIFAPISSISRVNGDFDNLLMYGGVRRADKEPLYGAFVALTKPPADPHVSYLLFGGEFGELRRDSIKRIENYSTATIESPMTLLSNPARGSKVIQTYQRVGEKLPSIGDVYCLRQDKQGYADLTQYIQVVKVEATERTFTNADGKEFVRMVIKMEISQTIGHDFIGIDYPVERYADAPTKVRETHVADAGAYFGIKPIVQAVKAGSSSIQVSSITEKIVPTAQVETVIADQKAVNLAPVIKPTATPITLGMNITNTTVHLPPVSPHTLTTANGITDQNGKLIKDAQPIGTIDYATGELHFDVATQFVNPTFAPALVHTPFIDTYRIDIDLKNRSYNHVITLPNVGSLTVSYMAQGKWYELKDNGSGVLVGASKEHGTGTVNYRTGTVVLTCGLMPDVGSAIIFGAGNLATLDEVDDIKAYYVYTLSDTPNLDSLTVDNIKTDKAGHFAHGFFKDGILYSKNKVSQIRYNTGKRQSVSITAPTLGSDNKYHLNLSDTAIAGVELAFPLRVMNGEKPSDTQIIQRLYDDGKGNLKDSSGNVAGSVDYATGTAKINQSQTIYTSTPTYRTETYTVRKGGRIFGPKYVTHTRQVFDGVGATAGMGMFEPTVVQASFYDNTDGAAKVQDFNDHLVAIQTPANVGVVFRLGNSVYFVKDGGVYDAQNVRVGTPNGFAHNGDMTARLICGARISPIFTVDEVSFRTTVAPVRLNSVQVRATLLDGTSVSAVADADGNLDGEWITGRVDAKFGLVTVSFGKLVDGTPTGDETAENGQIWQPAQVIADSIVYNAIGMSHLPINSTAVKIDTVRLPTDGQVPIFRRGDTVLIGDRQTYDIGTAHKGGQTITLPRQNLDRICVMDKNGKAVNAELWDYDLDAGSITWANPLDLSGYEMPLNVMHAFEEKNRVIDVDIDGTLGLMFPIKHDYDRAYVSGVLIGGDLQVRHSIPFTQTNWDGVWRDEAHGTPLLNRLNLTDYPMTLTDDGAISERWLIRFTSPSQFELYGEKLGFVGKADTLTDLAPINPATGKPYFTLPKNAFGQGSVWATQNVIRFNTQGTLMPFWVLRAVQPNPHTPDGDDGFTMCLFGDTTK